MLIEHKDIFQFLKFLRGNFERKLTNKMKYSAV